MKVPRQKKDELIRKYKKRIPKEYGIVTIAYNEKLEHSYLLAKHIIRDKYIFCSSNKKRLIHLLEYEIFVLADMFMQEKYKSGELEKEKILDENQKRIFEERSKSMYM